VSFTGCKRTVEQFSVVPENYPGKSELLKGWMRLYGLVYCWYQVGRWLSENQMKFCKSRVPPEQLEMVKQAALLNNFRHVRE